MEHSAPICQLVCAHHALGERKKGNLLNRRAFLERAENELARMHRCGQRVCISVGDIDAYKALFLNKPQIPAPMNKLLVPP